MFTRTLRIIAFGASCFAVPALAGDSARLRHAPAVKHHVAADRDPYADPAAPYKADRLSSRPDQPILDMSGQTTVLTRQVLDDKNATSLKDAMDRGCDGWKIDPNRLPSTAPEAGYITPAL